MNTSGTLVMLSKREVPSQGEQGFRCLFSTSEIRRDRDGRVSSVLAEMIRRLQAAACRLTPLASTRTVHQIRPTSTSGTAECISSRACTRVSSLDSATSPPPWLIDSSAASGRHELIHSLVIDRHRRRPKQVFRYVHITSRQSLSIECRPSE